MSGCRLAVISNRLSHRNRRALPAVERAARALPGVDAIALDGIDGLAPTLARLIADDVRAIALNGGDGTVQAALTALHGEGCLSRMPPLVILRGGRTNLIADDVGPPGRADRALARVAAFLASNADPEPHLRRRHVLHIDNVDGQPFACGMFLGAGGIVAAIRLCIERAHRLGLEADLASALTFAIAVKDWLFRRQDSPLFQGYPIGVAVDGHAAVDGRRAALFATTLERLMLGIRPFWGDAGRPIRFTGFPYPPRHLLLQVPRILYGGRQRRIAETIAFSGGADRLELSGTGTVALDGEFLDPVAARPLVIRAVGPVRFLSV